MNVPLTPLRCLERAATLYGGKEAIVCGSKRFTYLQFSERSRRLAAALTALGLNSGDRVAFLSFNSHQLLEGYYGVPQAGGIVMPLNVRLTVAELQSIIGHSKPSILFCEDEFRDTAEKLMPASPGIKLISLAVEYENLLAAADPHPPDLLALDENAIAELFYTSGSTGHPRGVMLSHRTVYLHALSCIVSMRLDEMGVELHTIPLFHANGWGRPQTATMMGMKQVMVRRFEAAKVCRLIQEERATSMSLVPTMANALLNFPDIEQYDLTSMRQIYLGGAAASPELITRLEERFGCEALTGYGMTETSPVVASSRRKSTVVYSDIDDRAQRQSMAGWAAYGIELRVVDEQMNDVPCDGIAEGELVARGDQVMDGYFDDPEGTEAVMAGGWLHTGDIACWDKERYIRIVDRRKDIIISGGENISTLEIERALCAHPAVLEAAVVSAPDPKWGEIPVACVTLREGHAACEEELREFLKPKIAGFKYPRRYEISTEPLPKGGTGKVQKRQLREKFWTGTTTRVQG